MDEGRNSIIRDSISEYRLTNMFSRNRFVLLADLLLIVVAAFGSYALRLELTEDFFRFYLQAGQDRKSVV